MNTVRRCPKCQQQTGELNCPHDGEATVVDAASPQGMVGQTIGDRYVVTKLIGEGGFGAVYKANHKGTGDVVAIKVLHTNQAGNAEMVGRFQREAATTASLKQPHTVRVFDFGQTNDGNLYLAMEFLDGRTLSHVAHAEGPIGYERACHFAVQVLKSLAEAHSRGLVHRDLKPDNIFVQNVFGEEDFVKVLDFGIAKSLAADGQSRTATGVIIGTPPYMSPEQARGAGVDHRTDLYALGCILYEMLTGRVPFESESAMDTLIQRLTQPPPDPAGQCLSATPPAFCAAVKKLLATQPGDRYADAAETIKALQAAAKQAPSPETARPNAGVDVFGPTLAGDVSVIGAALQVTATGRVPPMPTAAASAVPVPTLFAAPPPAPAPALAAHPVAPPSASVDSSPAGATVPTALPPAKPTVPTPLPAARPIVPRPAAPLRARQPAQPAAPAHPATAVVSARPVAPAIRDEQPAEPPAKSRKMVWVALGAVAAVAAVAAIALSGGKAPPAKAEPAAAEAKPAPASESPPAPPPAPTAKAAPSPAEPPAPAVAPAAAPANTAPPPAAAAPPPAPAPAPAQEPIAPAAAPATAKPASAAKAGDADDTAAKKAKPAAKPKAAKPKILVE